MVKLVITGRENLKSCTMMWPILKASWPQPAKLDLNLNVQFIHLHDSSSITAGISECAETEQHLVLCYFWLLTL